MYKNYEALLVKTNKTNCRVAKDVGITQTTLANWRDGKSTPHAGTLRKIANYFGVTVDYLLGEEDDAPPVVHSEISNRQYEKYGRL